MKSDSINIKKYIPNIISTIRIMSVIPICILYSLGNYPLATLIFGLASASDFVDGFLARKWNVESKYGKYADAFGDKILIIPTIITHLIHSFSFGLESILISSMFIIEGAIGITNGISKVIKKKDVNSSIIGKIKTAVLMSTLFLSLCTSFITNNIFSMISNIILPITTITLQALSLNDYLKKATSNDSSIQNNDLEQQINIVEDEKEEDIKKLTKYNTNKNDIIDKLKMEKNLLLSHDNDVKTKKIGQKHIEVDKK